MPLLLRYTIALSTALLALFIMAWLNESILIRPLSGFAMGVIVTNAYYFALRAIDELLNN